MYQEKMGYEEWLAQLTQYGQQHLLGFWHQLDETQRGHLLQQLQSVDFSQMSQLIEAKQTNTDWEAMASGAGAPPAVRLQTVLASDVDFARRLGEQALRGGRVAVVVVAGGQGSRLGFPHPKGMFPIGPVSRRTLFEVHVDRLRAVGRRYQTRIPLYVMTSPATHAETLEYFQQHDHLGIPAADLIPFCQGTMPALAAETGKLLLEAPDRLFLSPDGHGGMLAALEESGALKDLERRGIDLLFYFQVDNPLVAVADPVFLGHHLRAGSEMTTQVIAKKDPLDKVGNVILHNKRVHVIEYSDLPDAAAQRRTPTGELAIWAGSIAVHAINVSFLRRASSQADSLPFHLARKIVPHIDADGTQIEPTVANAIKFERFIFDLLPLAENAIVVEVDESQAFAPLKNAVGAPKDTEQTVQEAMVAQHRSWIDAAQGTVDEGVQVEINPLFAYDAQEFAEKTAPGLHLTSDRYFSNTNNEHPA